MSGRAGVVARFKPHGDIPLRLKSGVRSLIEDLEHKLQAANIDGSGVPVTERRSRKARDMMSLVLAMIGAAALILIQVAGLKQGQVDSASQSAISIDSYPK